MSKKGSTDGLTFNNNDYLSRWETRNISRINSRDCKSRVLQFFLRSIPSDRRFWDCGDCVNTSADVYWLTKAYLSSNYQQSIRPGDYEVKDRVSGSQASHRT